MSIIDPDPDAEFLRIMEGVELEEPTDTIDYTTLNDIELSTEYDGVRRALFETGELHNHNATGYAGELHSKFSAINVEMRRRWRPTGKEEDQ